MKKFKVKDNVDTLNNLELMDYKKKLYAHGYEMESYLQHLQSHYINVCKILKERVEDLEYDMCIIQAEREDTIGDVDHPDHYVH